MSLINVKLSREANQLKRELIDGNRFKSTVKLI